MNPGATASTRAAARRRFLAAAGREGAEPVSLAADASFRQYYRVAGNPPAVLMDAPPAHEDVRPFLAVTGYLRGLGLSAPENLAADVENGFLLLEDLGDDRLSGLLAAGKADERGMYRLAIDVLIHLQAAGAPAMLPVSGGADFTVPAYDMGCLIDEALLLPQWYIPAVTDRPLPAEAMAEYEDIWRALLGDIAECRDALVLRDYHVDNLMWLGGRSGLERLGLLDYQDAVLGHPAYDVVSLLEDARRDVPPDVQEEMLAYYIERCGIADEAAFRRAYALLGAQRNMKIIGIFTRLSRRDGKHGYLRLIPHVWRLLTDDLDRLSAPRLTAWLKAAVPPERRVAPGPPPDPEK